MNAYRMAEWLATLSDDILAVFETGRGCVNLSANWERLTGHTKSEGLRNGFFNFLPSQQEQQFTEALMHALNGETLPEADMLFQLVCAEGEARWFRLVVGEVERRIGGYYRLVCCLKDVQAEREVEAQLARHQRDARLTSRTRNELLNAMSHDLRTPLNAILGFTQIMESGMYGDIDNPQYQEYLRHMRESGYELLAQIDALMANADAKPVQVFNPARVQPPQNTPKTPRLEVHHAPFEAVAVSG